MRQPPGAQSFIEHVASLLPTPLDGQNRSSSCKSSRSTRPLLQFERAAGASKRQKRYDLPTVRVGNLYAAKISAPTTLAAGPGKVFGPNRLSPASSSCGKLPSMT